MTRLRANRRERKPIKLEPTYVAPHFSLASKYMSTVRQAPSAWILPSIQHQASIGCFKIASINF